VEANSALQTAGEVCHLRLPCFKNRLDCYIRQNGDFKNTLSVLATCFSLLVLFFSSLWSPYVIWQTIIFLPCSFYILLLLLMAALCNRGAIIFSPCSFFLLLPIFFYLLLFFPRLISAAGDWMSAILPHMVWP